jgi:hypothetical protein
MTPPSPRGRFHEHATRAVRIVVPLAVVAVLVWLLQRIGWDRIGQVFVTLGWTGLAILLPFGFLENFFDARAFYAALLKRIPLRVVLAYGSQGALVNMVIPGEVGEVYKSTRLKRHSSWGDSLSGTIIWNYLLKLTNPLSRLAMVLLGFCLGHGPEPWVASVIALAVVLSFAPYLVLRLLVRQGMAHTAVRFLRFIRILRKNPEALLQAAQDLDSRDYSLGVMAMVFAGTGVATYLLSLLPARFGVSEGVGYFIFSLVGLDAAAGLAVFIILRVKAIVTLGIYSLLHLK